MTTSPETFEELAGIASKKYHSLTDILPEDKKSSKEKNRIFNMIIEETRNLYGAKFGGISKQMMLQIYNNFKIPKKPKPKEDEVKKTFYKKITQQLSFSF